MAHERLRRSAAPFVTARSGNGRCCRSTRRRCCSWVRRQISPEQAERLAALKLDGIGFLKESRRFYPKNELAAHLLGYVGIDNKGLAGIESTYDSQIRGKDGTLLIQTDARRQAFSRLEEPPTAGSSIELTIDENLQYIAERELAIGVRENRAAGGTAVVMNPRTGEILAMANVPTFNPNVYREAQEVERRNRAIQDIYEPGSTFKVVTASAAIEEKVIPIDALIDTSPGVIRIGGRVDRRVRRTQLRCALLQRCDRQIEQHRRHQDWHAARSRAFERLRAPFRIRTACLARFPGREPRHRLERG